MKKFVRHHKLLLSKIKLKHIEIKRDLSIWKEKELSQIIDYLNLLIEIEESVFNDFLQFHIRVVI